MSEIISDGSQDVFSEFVAVDGVWVKGRDLVDGLVEWQSALVGVDYAVNGIKVGVWDVVAIGDESGIAVDDGFTLTARLVIISVLAVIVL